MIDRLLNKMGLVRVSRLKKILDETESYHQKLQREYKEFYFDMGAMSAVDHIRYELGLIGWVLEYRFKEEDEKE